MNLSKAESQIISSNNCSRARRVAVLAGTAGLTLTGCMPLHHTNTTAAEASVMPAPVHSSASHPARSKYPTAPRQTSRPAHHFAAADIPTTWTSGFIIKQVPGLVGIYNFGTAPSGKTAIAETPRHTNGSVTTDHIRTGDREPRVILECQGGLLVAQNEYRQLKSFTGNPACQNQTLTEADKADMPTVAELTYGGQAPGHFIPAQPLQQGS